MAITSKSVIHIQIMCLDMNTLVFFLGKYLSGMIRSWHYKTVLLRYNSLHLFLFIIIFLSLWTQIFYILGYNPILIYFYYWILVLARIWELFQLISVSLCYALINVWLVCFLALPYFLGTTRCSRIIMYVFFVLFLFLFLFFCFLFF